jgi:tRNA-specific 2-thiouridylase
MYITRNLFFGAQGSEPPLLYQSQLTALNCHWITPLTPPNSSEFLCSAKVRYRQTEQPCRVNVDEYGQCNVLFLEPQRAITPGQSVVFYKESICLGGGIIQ